jgi:hypothetical protein
MPVVTVPGANGTVVTQTFANASGNYALAQAIQAQLLSLQASGGLTVQTNPALPGNELVLTTSNASLGVPSGFSFVVDSTAGASQDVVLTGQNQGFLGGYGNLTVAGAGSGTITGADNPSGAAGGNEFVLLTAGSQYQVGLNGGSDTVVAAGTGTIFGGTGQDTFNVVGGSDTITAAAGSPSNTLFNNGGKVDFMAAAGTGSAPSLTSIVGGAGGSTTVIGANNNIVFYTAASSSPGALLQAGTGNETLWGAAVGPNAGSSANDALVGAPIAGTNDLMVAGTGTDIMVAGAGNDTMWNNPGGNSHSFFFFISGHAGGTDSVFLGPNGAAELTGYDTLFGGKAGTDTAAQAILAGRNADGSAATASASGLTYKLGDGTTVTFQGFANATQLAGHVGSS